VLACITTGQGQYVLHAAVLHKNTLQQGHGGRKDDTKLHIIIIKDIHILGSIWERR